MSQLLVLRIFAGKIDYQEQIGCYFYSAHPNHCKRIGREGVAKYRNIINAVVFKVEKNDGSEPSTSFRDELVLRICHGRFEREFALCPVSGGRLGEIL